MGMVMQRASPAAMGPRHVECFGNALDWPISAASLDALVDLGLSNACIAHYYRVTVDDVIALARQRGVYRQAVGE